MIAIDAQWRADNPLPVIAEPVSKKTRGRVLAVGGSRLAQGAIRLTAEAALRAGAGSVRIATLQSVAPVLAQFLPEAGIVPLPEADGEIGAFDAGTIRHQVVRHDAVVLGCGITDEGVAARLLRCILETPPDDTHLLLDAAALACAKPLREALVRLGGRLVFTPHEGEMAALSGRSIEAVREAAADVAAEIAERYAAVVVLKGGTTVIANPAGTCLHYPGGGPGMATGGSGDVLAGVIGGLLARGTPPLAAAAWGVWLHGQAGRTLASRIGPVGFLARELLPELPRLLPR